MDRLVTRVGNAIDAAKKGKRPSSQVRRDAELGDAKCMIEVAAFEFADTHRCGCNDHDDDKAEPAELGDNDEFEDGYESLSLDDETDLLIPN